VLVLEFFIVHDHRSVIAINPGDISFRSLRVRDREDRFLTIGAMPPLLVAPQTPKRHACQGPAQYHSATGPPSPSRPIPGLAIVVRICIHRLIDQGS
jgi:hypothetical protein